MKALRIAIIFLITSMAPLLITAQEGMSLGVVNRESNAQTSQLAAIRINSPSAGARVTGSDVQLQFQLFQLQLSHSAVAADSTPMYQVQLDGGAPFDTTDTSHTFTNVQPGKHTIAVVVVDANHTPIANTRTQIQFTTAPQVSAAPAGGMGALKVKLQLARERLQVPHSDDSNSNLPKAGGELPLLSVVGFGVLVGGIISAMRTRR